VGAIFAVLAICWGECAAKFSNPELKYLVTRCMRAVCGTAPADHERCRLLAPCSRAGMRLAGSR
jgi:hypothetical protein